MLDCPLELSFIPMRPYASKVLFFPCFFFSKYLIFGHMAYGILVPWPGIERTSPALEAWRLSHWTTGKSPALVSLLVTCFYSLETFKSSLYLVLWHVMSWVRCRPFSLTCSALSLLFSCGRAILLFLSGNHALSFFVTVTTIHQVARVRNLRIGHPGHLLPPMTLGPTDSTSWMCFRWL